MLRVSEVYNSFQGEGPNTGKPTTFVRFAGCNLKCAGWACDTPHAIDPKIFTKEQRRMTPLALIEEINASGMPNVCYTGGEVFLQDSDDLERVLHGVAKNHTASGRVTQEVFTNGTRPIPSAAEHRLDTIVLDWKLPGSGETVAFGPDTNVMHNINKLGPNDALKFTVKHYNDYANAKLLYNTILPWTTFSGVVYCGVVWDGIETRELAEWMLQDKLPWRLNVQVHKYIWPPDARGT